MGSFQTPVAFILFNRPEETARTFESLRALKPARLFLIADGPRAGREEEKIACARAREVTQNIDWECEVTRDFSEINLGCKKRVSTGITGVFSQVEEAIILEDDCVPDASFFTFCQEMLAKYREDARVMSIAGVNFQFQNTSPDASYYFSRYNHIWGWASWRRAWNLYHPDIPAWPAFRDSGRLRGIVQRKSTQSFFRYVFDALHAGKIDTWDGQWTFAHFANRGACIIPDRNLISNIGFGASGTHTKNQFSRYAAMKTSGLSFPLIHPENMAFFAAADEYTEKTLYSPRIPIWLKEILFKFIR